MVHILTDRRELALAIQIYDAANADILMTFHESNAINSRLIGLEKPDLVLGSHLSAPEVVELMQPLEMEAPVYDVIKHPGLMPLSFTLPMIVGRKDTMATLPDPFLVTPEELRAAANAFNRKNRQGRITRMGFSPLWCDRFITDLMDVRYPNLIKDGPERVNKDNLSSVMDELRSWVNSSAGGPAQEQTFSQRYRYIPDEQLILERRIAFTRMSPDEWAALPDSITSQLDFRYLSGNRHIPVPNIVSAGIPKKSRQSDAARDFLEWLIRPETQLLLIDRWEQAQIPVFGYFGGLSAQEDVNNSEFTRHFPYMDGRIPEQHYLLVPEQRPHRWSRIASEVIPSWTASVLENPVQSQTLEEAYREWDLSSLTEEE